MLDAPTVLLDRIKGYNTNRTIVDDDTTYIVYDSQQLTLHSIVIYNPTALYGTRYTLGSHLSTPLSGVLERLFASLEIDQKPAETREVLRRDFNLLIREKLSAEAFLRKHNIRSVSPSDIQTALGSQSPTHVPPPSQSPLRHHTSAVDFLGGASRRLAELALHQTPPPSIHRGYPVVDHPLQHAVSRRGAGTGAGTGAGGTEHKSARIAAAAREAAEYTKAHRVEGSDARAAATAAHIRARREESGAPHDRHGHHSDARDARDARAAAATAHIRARREENGAPHDGHGHHANAVTGTHGRSEW